MPSKHLDSPELDSLFLLHNLQEYEPLPRLQVSPKDTQRDGGGGGRREGMSDRSEGSHRQRDLESEGWKQKGTRRGVADGGR